MNNRPSTLFALILSFVVLIFSSASFAKPALEWEPKKLEVLQMQGTHSTITVSIKVNEDASDVVARIVPELTQWVTVSPASFGDIQKGDTLEIEITVQADVQEPLAEYGGVLQLRAGPNQYNLAKPLPITVVITAMSDDGLPPDPGEAGKQTILGIDSDDDGVRDDIQRYIYFTYPGEPNTRNGLTQIARIFQNALKPDLAEGTEYDIAVKNGEAIECLFYVSDNPREQALSLRAEVLNTYARSRQYFKFDSQLAGKITSASDLPLDEHYKLCDFELQ